MMCAPCVAKSRSKSAELLIFYRTATLLGQITFYAPCYVGERQEITNFSVSATIRERLHGHYFCKEN